MNARRLLLFNIAFWLLAAGALLLNAIPTARTHMDVAYVRYAYFVVVGLLASGVMMQVYGSGWFSRLGRRLVWVVVLSAGAALVTAILINPITYMMIGRNIHTVPVEILSTGTLYFALLFFIWSALYFQLKGESLLQAPSPAAEKSQTSRVFQVEKRGEIRQLRANDLVCVCANGDYVDLVTAANTYLKKDTLANLEALLDPEPRFASISAETQTRLFRLDREAFLELMGANIEIVRGVLSVLCKRLRRSVKKTGPYR